MPTEYPKSVFDVLVGAPSLIPGFVREKPEGDTLEYKSWAVLDKKKDEKGLDRLARDVCAFANSAPGGLIVIGVDDERREVLKHKFSEVEGRRLHHALRKKINPLPTGVKLAKVSVPGFEEVMLLLVPCDVGPPHMVDNVVYVRRGDSAVPAAPQELTMASRFLADADVLAESSDPKKRKVAEAQSQGKTAQAAQLSLSVEVICATDAEHTALLEIRGAALAEQGRFEEALTLFEQAARRAELSGDSKALAGAAFNCGLASQEAGRPEDAVRWYSKALENNPQCAKAYNNRGNVLADKGDLDAAVADYDKALELNPKYPEAYYNRGRARAMGGAFDAAIADYDRAIAINPGYAEAYNCRGAARVGKGQLEEAIADFDRALEIDPKSAEAYNNRGIARHKKGEPDAAIADYNEALEINPDYAPAYRNRAMALADKGDWDAAIIDCERVIRINPEYAEAYHDRGLAQAKKGALDAAVADFDKALQINPKLVEAYGNRGIARAQKGDLDGAIADYSEAVKIKPDFAGAYYNRGNARAKKGEHQGALADYDRALELDARLLWAHYGRANALFGLGRYDDARSALNRSRGVLSESLHAAACRGMDAWQTVETEIADMIGRCKQEERIKAVLIFGRSAQLWHTPDRFLSGGVRDLDVIIIVDGFETRRDAVLAVSRLQGSTQTPMDIQVRDLAVWREQKRKDLFVKQEVLPKMRVLYGEA